MNRMGRRWEKIEGELGKVELVGVGRAEGEGWYGGEETVGRVEKVGRSPRLLVML